jgi:hypothetical protein
MDYPSCKFDIMQYWQAPVANLANEAIVRKKTQKIPDYFLRAIALWK